MALPARWKQELILPTNFPRLDESSTLSRTPFALNALLHLLVLAIESEKRARLKQLPVVTVRKLSAIPLKGVRSLGNRAATSSADPLPGGSMKKRCLVSILFCVPNSASRPILGTRPAWGTAILRTAPVATCTALNVARVLWYRSA